MSNIISHQQIQIKFIMGYNYTHIRMAEEKKRLNTSSEICT